MHLRTEADVGEAWGSYEVQTSAALQLCQEHNLTLIYLATGNRADAARFTDEAAAQNITVVGKLDLMEAAEDKEAFDAMSWDQQSLVDREIASRSSFFGGLVGVSFACNRLVP